MSEELFYIDKLKCPALPVELKKKLNFILPLLPPGYPCVHSKNVSSFGPAVWPAIGNINMNVLLYCIDYLEDLTVHFFWRDITLHQLLFYYRYFISHLLNLSVF